MREDACFLNAAFKAVLDTLEGRQFWSQVNNDLQVTLGGYHKTVSSRIGNLSLEVVKYPHHL